MDNEHQNRYTRKFTKCFVMPGVHRVTVTIFGCLGYTVCKGTGHGTQQYWKCGQSVMWCGLKVKNQFFSRGVTICWKLYEPCQAVLKLFFILCRSFSTLASTLTYFATLYTHVEHRAAKYVAVGWKIKHLNLYKFWHVNEFFTTYVTSTTVQYR